LLENIDFRDTRNEYKNAKIEVETLIVNHSEAIFFVHIFRSID